MARVAAVTTVVTEVKLKPALKTKLLKKLRQYAQMSAELAVLQAQMDAIKVSVDNDFVEAGEGNALMSGTEIDGFRVKMVCGTTSKLDEDKLMKDCDVTRAQLDACTTTKPSKPYIKISVPKAAGV